MTLQSEHADRIQAEAFAAARKYSNVNDACPYPFHTPEGRLFKEEFLWARTMFQLQEKALQRTPANECHR